MHRSTPSYFARDFDDVADELDFIFNQYSKACRWNLMPVEKGWRPLTDMYETEDKIVIVMDIAGISTNDVKLNLLRNVLTIRGIRRWQVGEKKPHFHKMEIDFGPFERRIELPAPVDHNRVTTRYLQGFLEIHLPKKESFGVDRVEIEIRGGEDG